MPCIAPTPAPLRSSVRAAAPLLPRGVRRKLRSASIVVVVSEVGAEEPVGPFLRERARLGEHDRHSWEAATGGKAPPVGRPGD